MCMQRALSSKMQLPISALPHILQGHITQVEGKVAEEKHKSKKLAKLGDAAISNLKLSMTHSLTGVGARRCYRI